MGSLSGEMPTMKLKVIFTYQPSPLGGKGMGPNSSFRKLIKKRPESNCPMGTPPQPFSLVGPWSRIAIWLQSEDLSDAVSDEDGGQG